VFFRLPVGESEGKNWRPGLGIDQTGPLGAPAVERRTFSAHLRTQMTWGKEWAAGKQGTCSRNCVVQNNAAVGVAEQIVDLIAL